MTLKEALEAFALCQEAPAPFDPAHPSQAGLALSAAASPTSSRVASKSSARVVDGGEVEDAGSESAVRQGGARGGEHELEKASSRRRVAFQGEEAGASSDDEEAASQGS